MPEYILTPAVDIAQEFIEIAHDFANPLDIIREAISNAIDARSIDRSSTINLAFEMQNIAGENTFVVRIEDDGKGMDENELQAFFDLGNSTRRGNINAIGEKGHGTKIYFNSKRIVVDTQKDGHARLLATLDSPFTRLNQRIVPTAVVQRLPAEGNSGTVITIYGYNNNRRDKFTHDRLKDYILWFTKFGSIEKIFGVETHTNVVLKLKGLDRDEFEEIQFGHIFPAESGNVNALFNEYSVQAPHYYCRRIVKDGFLPNSPEVRYQAVFSIEGRRKKYEVNPMLRRSGYVAPAGAYTIQDRYGLWLCKDHIPIQRKNEWINTKGSEYTKMHAFINCQSLNLTANRGSIENTPTEIIQDIEDVVKNIYQEIVQSEEWLQLDYLEEEVIGFNTVEKEARNYQIRQNKVNHANICEYNGHILIEPQRESGVHSLVVQLMTINSDLFPFSIIDYDTHEGIDLIVKSKDIVPTIQSRIYYVEFKYKLGTSFNHSFANLYNIICWDTDLRNGDNLTDIARETYTLQIIPPENPDDYQRYFLQHPRRAHRIEIFVLKYYLRDVIGINFRPRNQHDIL